MSEGKLKTLSVSIKGHLAQAATYLVSYATMQVMRFSMQTAVKLLILMFLPKLSFLVYSI